MSQLGTKALTWRRLDVLIRHLPPDCALYRSMTDDVLGWDLHAQLLAEIADRVGLGNWQRQGDSKKPRPGRIPRPGVADDSNNGTQPEEVEDGTVIAPEGETVVADPSAGEYTTTKKIGSDVRPVGEIRSIFDRFLVAARDTSGDGD